MKCFRRAVMLRDMLIQAVTTNVFSGPFQTKLLVCGWQTHSLPKKQKCSWVLVLGCWVELGRGGIGCRGEADNPARQCCLRIPGSRPPCPVSPPEYTNARLKAFTFYIRNQRHYGKIARTLPKAHSSQSPASTLFPKYP